MHCFTVSQIIKKNYHYLFHCSAWCVLGILGNLISIIVLRKDRERREALFLLQMLAAADLFYLLVALLRYPLKYILPYQQVYVEMQVIIHVQVYNDLVSQVCQLGLLGG